MEILIKNANFSAVAVTKLTAPFTTFLDGCYLSDGSFSTNNRYYHSLGVIPNIFLNALENDIEESY